ncbi:HD domain-containing phosphohydrolase [Desulforhopalus singaporensis]|uniref:Putative two-component system response regulator n=1 Tax=Desulforhopalus singaporensis TaxID=91360 RepID=A0A1H0VQP9_9BACT|nr:HD domain-containing phosphohydrolase [Desulforhopalus singaporensis]SDP80416.1 putative two-component system response regulator [Desulforhopalus singaporensis]
MKESKAKVLIVDDELLNRELLEDYVELLGYEGESVAGGEQALQKIRTQKYDMVLLDVMMPGFNGIETTRKIREDYNPVDLPIIMVTALSGRDDRLKAVEAGANDFIVKPVDKTELNVRISSQLKIKNLHDELIRHQHHLEELVQERTVNLKLALSEAERARHKTQRAHLDTIHRLGVAAEYKDKCTADHINRVSYFCRIVAESIGLPETEIEVITAASPMHDVGKIGIPDSILLKQGPLTNEEWEIMKKHTLIGEQILKHSDSPLLVAGAVIAATHHEKWDGSGYPYGLENEDIPILGRICAIADVFDALTDSRPYKDAFCANKALEIIKEGRGSHFDPRLVDAFVRNFDKIMAVKLQKN